MASAPFRIALHGFVPLRHRPAQKFGAMTLTLDGELIALGEHGTPLPIALHLTPDSDGPWSMQAGKFGTVLYPVLLGLLGHTNGPLPQGVRVTGTLNATTDAGENIPVFSRIERLGRRYAPPSTGTTGA